VEQARDHVAVRVVSLVPSVTETLIAFGVVPIACTRFCEQPDIVVVGGTKDPDVAGIVALRPDLVVVNDEENRYADAATLIDAGIAVHSMSPRSVEDVGEAVVDLAERVGAAVPAEFEADAWHAWLTAMLTPRWYEAFVAVWRRPWMSLAADTYGSSLLDLLGVGNVFAGSLERYPETTLDEVATLAPNLVLLPTEPYPFAERHVAEIALEVPGVPTVLVDGRDLFWWGFRTPAAAERLRDALPGLGATDR
jgi:ABC-type Fe3+-hydroxamate transport system substrate-binding protein